MEEGEGGKKGEILLLRTKTIQVIHIYILIYFFLLKTYKPPTQNSKDLIQSCFTSDCCKARAAVWRMRMLQPPATAAVRFFLIPDVERCLIRVLKPV